MDKNELKSLVMKYFNLQPNNTTENITEEVKQNFVEATLEDGTKIHAEGDAFEVGQTLHVVTSEGDYVTAPSGMHTTDSGIVLTVNEEGTITGIHHPDEEGEGSLEASEEEMSTEEVAEEKTEMAEHDVVEDTAEADVKEAVISAIADVVLPELEALKAKLAEHEEKLAKYEEKMSKSPANTSVTENKFKKAQKFENLVESLKAPDYKKSHYKAVLSRLEK